jgi:hypothetical protein
MQTDQKSDREGMIQVNDLVYKLEPDISVAVNRTHKTHYFQQPQYQSSQTSICILNSGADYIDTRRSFLRLQVNLSSLPYQIPTSQFDTIHQSDEFVKTAAQTFNDNLLVHGYFGPNGSILNLIDSVIVTTRSGDELSRVVDLAKLANMVLPLVFGKDWKKSVGGMMGMGDCLYGQSSKRKHPSADRTYAIPMYLLSPLFQYGRLMPSMLMSGLRITITWKSADKAFAQFVAKCPENGVPVNVGGFVAGCGFNRSGFLGYRDAQESTTSGELGGGNMNLTFNSLGLIASFGSSQEKSPWVPGDILVVSGTFSATTNGGLAVQVNWTKEEFVVQDSTALGTNTNIVTLATGHNFGDGNTEYKSITNIEPTQYYRVRGDITHSVLPGVHQFPYYDASWSLRSTEYLSQLTETKDLTEAERAEIVQQHGLQESLQSTMCPTDGMRGDGLSVDKGENGAEYTWPVHTVSYPFLAGGAGGFDDTKFAPDYWGTAAESSGLLDGKSRIMCPSYKYKGGGQNEFPSFINAALIASQPALAKLPALRRKYYQNPPFVEYYTILNPEFSLCSVQLSDAIQRTLNEYSAVNGLEIVYTDYDLTTSTVQAVPSGTSVYTEVRKSASRALQAFARICPNYSEAALTKMSDSNAATIQYAEDLSRAIPGRGWLDYQWQLGSLYFPQQKVIATSAYDMGPIAYAYTLEAFDRFSGGSTCMLELQGTKTELEDTGLTRTMTLQNWNQMPGAAPPDLLSQERMYVLGKPGSFQGGGEVISVSLERSSLFNLSGIPINNSRVLALRGSYSSIPTKYCGNHTLYIFLKYVKLARIFLNNVEVEQ